MSSNGIEVTPEGRMSTVEIIERVLADPDLTDRVASMAEETVVTKDDGGIELHLGGIIAASADATLRILSEIGFISRSDEPLES